MGYQRQKLEELMNLSFAKNNLTLYLNQAIETNSLESHIKGMLRSKSILTPNYEDLPFSLPFSQDDGRSMGNYENQYAEHLDNFYNFCRNNNSHLFLPSNEFCFEDENNMIYIQNAIDNPDNYIFTYFNYNHDTGDRSLLIFWAEIKDYDPLNDELNIDLEVLHYSVYDNSGYNLVEEYEDLDLKEEIDSITDNVPKEAFEKAAYMYRLDEDHY